MNITLDDPRLTAYVLGELDEAGRTVIETEMRNFDECRGEVEAITRAAALLRSELASESVPALTHVERNAIEAKLILSGSKPGHSWIPLLESGGLSNWRLRTGLALALALMICAVSISVKMPHGIQTFFQNATADTAYAMMKMAGTKVIKDGLKIRLSGVPGMSLMVEPSCCSIGWSRILLVASFLIGILNLRSPWKWMFLTLFVILLQIVRDGFHIFTLVELCVHVGPSVMNSPILRQGGPLFFALSLIPFLLFLIWLRRLESKP